MNAQENSTFKGTPGEWFAVNQDVRCGDPTDPIYIAIAWAAEPHSPSFDEAVANALVMAASKDLLTALRGIVMGFGHKSPTSTIWKFSISEKRLAQSRAAIAKALGQAVPE